MTSKSTWAVCVLVLGIAAAGLAQAATAQSASADPAASGVKSKKPMKARVTGGPGYVSEATPASGASPMPS